MNLIEKKARGQHAETLLEDEMLKEALREVQYAAHRAFEAAAGDAVKLQRASDMLAGAKLFQRFLTIAVKQGAAATKEIEKELKGGAFVRGVGRLVRNRDAEADDMPWSPIR